MNLEQIKNQRIKMILQFSIPSIIAMVLTSLITVADGFFIGNYVGKEGLAAVNLGMPIVYLFLAIGLMISVGGIAIAGMAFGGGDLKKCNDTFNQTIVTVIIIAITISVLMRFCLDPMLGILKVDRQLAARYFKEYYSIMLLQFPIMVVNTSLGMFIRGEGKPQYFMQVNIFNVLLNIFLDYLFIRWFGWGVSGIAAASLIAALTTLSLILFFFIKKSEVYKFRKFAFSSKELKDTILNGSSEFIGEISLGISMFAYNFVILKNIGMDGVTAFTVVGYIAFMFNMVIIGFGQGASPLISFVYGAKESGLAASLRKITNTFVFLPPCFSCFLTLEVKIPQCKRFIRCASLGDGGSADGKAQYR